MASTKIFEYEFGNEDAYITVELTSQVKSFLLNAQQARFCIYHTAQKYGEIDTAAWYTPAYFINNTDIFDNRTKTKFYGSPLPQIADWSSPISVSATDPFTTVFDNLLAAADNTYKPDGFSKETRSFQYWHTYDMETSGNISMYDMNDFVSLLKRKYLVQAFARSFDGLDHKVLFQNIKKNPTDTGFDYIGKLQLISDTSNRNIRLFYTDETGLVTDTGYGTKSHNLGFIPSTANASELTAMTGIQKPSFRITECFDPRHENGDLLEITTPAIQDSPYYTLAAYITVRERFKNGEYLETIIETPTFPDGIGASGAVKSNSKNTGIANVLDTSQFSIILNTTDSTLQKAIDKLDDHDHSGLATTEGIQDIIGAMLTGNTETGIAVTYDDSDGTIDFDAQTAGDARYAPIAKGVTNGDSHNHVGGDGAALTYVQTLPMHGLNGTPAAGSTNYLPPYYYGVNATGYNFLTSIPGTVKNLSVVLNSAQPGTGSLVFTVQKNNVDTAIVITVAAGSAAGTYTNTANTVSVVATDKIIVKVVNNASGASAQIGGGSLQIEANTG